ncbi:MAG: response regulator transcription factor [Lachnospiraceae bacterium]|nr:response regulator transcription factor [Lachnospiraceae bacterium]
MKIQVGICDDNEYDLTLMESEVHRALRDVCKDYDIRLFKSGNVLMHDVESILTYDLLLLDIDMPGVDGIQIAETIMKRQHQVNVIFVTNRDDLVFEAIHYSPFRFIRKQHLHKELPEAITAAIAKISEETLLYRFGSGTDDFKIPICDVMYLESQKHYIAIHTKQGDITIIRGKISDYEDKLCNIGFIRIHVGYLVNIRFVYSITSQKIVLDNKEELPISRTKVDMVKQAHASFVRRFVRGIY